MRPADVFRLGFAALARQKVRTALTTVGVVVGTVVLLLSLSIGQGLREAILEGFRRHDELRTITVWPGWGEPRGIPEEDLKVEGRMSEAKRARIRRLIEEDLAPGYRGTYHRLTPETVAELAEIDHVAAVHPWINFHFRLDLAGEEREVLAAGLPVAPPGEGGSVERAVRRRVVLGTPFARPDERGLLISEYVLYQWGVRDDDEVEALLGRKVRLRLMPRRPQASSFLYILGVDRPVTRPEEEELVGKVIARLPDALGKLDLTAEEQESLKKLLAGPSAEGGEADPAASLRPIPVPGEFAIAGVLREPDDSDRDDSLPYRPSRGAAVYLPLRTAEEIHALLPPHLYQSYTGVSVLVDGEENVRAVNEAIKAKGYETHTLVTVVEQVRLNILLISFATAFVAVVALAVAALGITNTLLMSVLERTHEIGVMKAVGARDGHVLALFVVEGTVLGLAGSLLGLLIAWLASFPGDSVARSMIEEQTRQPFTGSVFAFPWWLTLGVPAFVTLLTTAAAVYPARRAARVNPVVALRHE